MQWAWHHDKEWLILTGQTRRFWVQHQSPGLVFYALDESHLRQKLWHNILADPQPQDTPQRLEESQFYLSCMIGDHAKRVCFAWETLAQAWALALGGFVNLTLTHDYVLLARYQALYEKPLSLDPLEGQRLMAASVLMGQRRKLHVARHVVPNDSLHAHLQAHARVYEAFEQACIPNARAFLPPVGPL